MQGTRAVKELGDIGGTDRRNVRYEFPSHVILN
jgi:hypothetical protein